MATVARRRTKAAMWQPSSIEAMPDGQKAWISVCDEADGLGYRAWTWELAGELDAKGKGAADGTTVEPATVWDAKRAAAQDLIEYLQAQPGGDDLHEAIATVIDWRVAVPAGDDLLDPDEGRSPSMLDALSLKRPGQSLAELQLAQKLAGLSELQDRLNGHGAGAGQRIEVPIDQVKPSPLNPRKEFGEAELAELAATITSQGMIQDLVVRRAEWPTAGNTSIEDRDELFELIAGERRWRAAKLAGLTKVWVKVVVMTDAQVCEAALVENLARKDLSPMEEAESYRRLTEPKSPTFVGTQTELAAKLGKSQGEIANRIRLLQLPEPWRSRVTSREMSASHARALLPWIGTPSVMKGLNDRWLGKGDFYGEPGKVASLSDWEDDIDHIVREIDAKEDKSHAKAKAKAKTLTKAQLDAKRKLDEQQLKNRISTWRTDWLRYLVFEEIEANAAGQLVTAQLLLWLTVHSDSHGRTARLFDSLAEGGYPAPKGSLHSFAWESCLFKPLSIEMAPISKSFVRRLLWDGKQSQASTVFPDRICEQAAAALSIDLAARWKKDLAGPLTERFLGLHQKNQLLELATKTWGSTLTDKCGKSEIIERLLGPDRKTMAKLPASIKPIAASGKGGKR